MRLNIIKLVLINFISLAFSVSVHGRDNGKTTVEISGTLVAEPCDLAPESSAVNIDFGTIVKKSFLHSSRTETQPFSVKIINCDLSVGGKASFSFKGTESSILPGMLSVNEGEMKSVAIGFEYDDGKPLNINQYSDYFPLSSGDNIFKFGAYVQAGEEAVAKNEIVAGDFSASATFEIDYQ